MESLAEVLSVEAAIRKTLEDERSKAAAWLAEKTSDLRRATEARRAHLREAATADDAALTEAANLRATTMVREALAQAERMRTVADERLTPIVWAHIQSIAPGADRDRQDVED